MPIRGLRLGCELEFGPLLANNMNDDNVFPNDSGSGERSYDWDGSERAFGLAVRERGLIERNR
jgi:hypothetical protein